MKASGSEKIRAYNERLQSLYEKAIGWLNEAEITFVPVYALVLFHKERNLH